jgi:hypothetical protein
VLRCNAARLGGPGHVERLRNWVDNMEFPACEETQYLGCYYTGGNGELATSDRETRTRTMIFWFLHDDLYLISPGVTTHPGTVS